MQNIPSEEELRKKAARKARPGGVIKWRNLPRNWVHQAISYMDSGELLFRVVIESVELMLAWFALVLLFPGVQPLIAAMFAFVLVHTWNWVTNGLFWSVVIFTFPTLKNPGAQDTIAYLNEMRERLSCSACISGVAIYGSVTRHAWHDRSDIDIRFLRRKGLMNLICAAFLTMLERFRALLAKQPMDLYLADDTDFLEKMRSDEVPVLLMARDDRLKSMYPDCSERQMTLVDLVGEAASAGEEYSR